VAVQEPDARVVSLNGDHYISLSWQQGNISTGRIGRELRRRFVEVTGALGENKEVVAVNVDWVRLWQILISIQCVQRGGGGASISQKVKELSYYGPGFLDDKVEPLILVGEFDNLPSLVQGSSGEDATQGCK
jgi:hypothetical protein